MGLRGPAPTPTAILEARGSWLAKHREGEVQFERGMLPCPKWLSPAGKREWKKQAKQLDSAGLLQVVDGAMLAAYCEAWAEFVEMCEAIKEKGRLMTTSNGNVIQNPLVSIRNRAVERLFRLAQQFGFSPSARVRIRAGDPEPEEATKGKARFFRHSS